MFGTKRKIHLQVEMRAAALGIRAILDSRDVFSNGYGDELSDEEVDIEIDDADEIEKRAWFVDE